MFGWPKSKQQASSSLRDTLVTDHPLEDWLARAKSLRGEPWSSMAAAVEAMKVGRNDEAIATLKAVLTQPDLETRHLLETWEGLRALNVQAPLEQAKRVLGVVLEVPMDKGIDLLAVYADGLLRYYNHSGAGVVWEHPDDRLDAGIQGLLAAGQNVANRIGPWKRPRPPAPPPGVARLSFLTPGGLHFGQAPLGALSTDAMATQVLNAGAALVTKLTPLAGPNPPGAVRV